MLTQNAEQNPAPRASLYQLLSRVGVGRVNRERHFPDADGQSRWSALDLALQTVRNVAAASLWKVCGRPIPPPHVMKVQCVKSFQKRLRLSVLIETGTLLGDMIRATRRSFEEIYSIELHGPLYERASRRFANDHHIHILNGDSARVLPGLLGSISQPCLFWLDGHYDGTGTARGDVETPILQELEAIRQHPVRGHAILIDDARCFTGTGGYPTLSEVSERLQAIHPSYRVEVRDDIIRAYVDETS